MLVIVEHANISTTLPLTWLCLLIKTHTHAHTHTHTHAHTHTRTCTQTFTSTHFYHRSRFADDVIGLLVLLMMLGLLVLLMMLGLLVLLMMLELLVLLMLLFCWCCSCVAGVVDMGCWCCWFILCISSNCRLHTVTAWPHPTTT